jgi:hypothetical protein
MANFFELNGQDVKITYRIGGDIGPVTTGGSRLIVLTYDDKARDIHEGFRANQIDTAQTPLGMMVTVTIRMTIDSGATSFSMFLPDLDVPHGQKMKFNSLGVYRDARGPFVIPKEVKVSWSSIQLDGVAETVILPF